MQEFLCEYIAEPFQRIISATIRAFSGIHFHNVVSCHINGEIFATGKFIYASGSFIYKVIYRAVGVVKLSVDYPMTLLVIKDFCVFNLST